MTDTRATDPGPQPPRDPAIEEPTDDELGPDFRLVEPEDEDDVEEVVVYIRRPYWWWWLVTVATVVVTFFVARAIPPWYPIGTWWGAFFTSAGFGGSLAVVGAGTAAYIAYHNSQKDREQKRVADEMARWWDRFAWACEQAVSTKKGESEMGLVVLESLIDSPLTSDDDIDMTVGVLNVVDANKQHVGGSADNAGAAPNTAPTTSQKGWH